MIVLTLHVSHLSITCIAFSFTSHLIQIICQGLYMFGRGPLYPDTVVSDVEIVQDVVRVRAAEALSNPEETLEQFPPAWRANTSIPY